MFEVALLTFKSVSGLSLPLASGAVNATGCWAVGLCVGFFHHVAFIPVKERSGINN